MRYVKARAAEYTDCETYRYYVASALKATADNTAGFVQKGEGIAMSYDKFKARVHEMSKGTVETRTGEEIVEHMKNVLGKLGG